MITTFWELTKVINQLSRTKRLHALRQLGALARAQEHGNTVPQLHPSEVDAKASVGSGTESAVGRFCAFGVGGAAGRVVEEAAGIKVERVRV